MSSIVFPTLTAEEQASCKGYLTVNECYNALKQLGSSKTPGMDGLTKEFYLAFWDVVHSDLIRCLNKSFDKGTLSTSQQQVVITLLEKPGKDKRFLLSWRPISLIKVDTKICSKALSNRVCKVITKLVDSDQEAFIKGRNIEDSIRLIDNLMVTPEQVANQVLWNNKYIKVDNSPVFFPQLASKGIFRIKDLYNETNETNWETVLAMGVEPHHYLYRGQYH